MELWGGPAYGAGMVPNRALLLSAALSLIQLAAVDASTAADAAPRMSSVQVVERFNAVRRASGLPPVRERAALSRACRAHNGWMQANGVLQHGEVPGSPRYSVDGAAAGRSSVLAWGASWSRGNPWRNGPIHLAAMLVPGMVETGGSEAFGFDCLVVVTEANLRAASMRPARGTVFGYPPNGASMPYAQTAFERPAGPANFAASPIPDGTVTGPNLITYVRGVALGGVDRWPHLARARLWSRAGVVPVLVLDARRIPYLLPGAGIIVPRQRLVPVRRYWWSATYTGPDGVVTSAPRSFTTTRQRLCGSGLSAPSAIDTCPWSFVSVRAPRGLHLGYLRDHPVSVRIVTDARASVAARLRLGTDVLARATVTLEPEEPSLARLQLGDAAFARVQHRIAMDGRAMLAVVLDGEQHRTERVLVVA